MLSPAFLDELRARTTLSQVVGRRVKLQRAGREFKACCPFHNERTPSFHVNDEKGFYHCFGCSAHGDAIRFLTETSGLSFIDAVKELAGAAGLEVPAPDPRAQARAERATGLIDVTEAAAAWFEEQLASPEGSTARAYLERRGISPSQRARFRLGFAPDSRGKLRGALSRFGDEALIEAGLLIKPDNGRDPYDRFRGRLIIPIMDARGRTIAFGGRILGEGEPKYLNSPETPLFDKGRTLFNLHRAAPAARESGRLIVVEGYLDAIALDGAGVAEAVAPLGTALTETQLALLWRVVPRPLLSFDGDAAGQRAAAKAVVRALPAIAPDRSLGFVTLPAGQDPDDLVRVGGRAAVDAAFAEPEPLAARLWHDAQAAEPLTSPEARAGLKQRLMEQVGLIGDRDVREQYRGEMLRRFDEAMPKRAPFVPGGGRASFTPGRGRWSPPPPRPRGPPLPDTELRELSALFVGLCRFPEVAAEHLEELTALPLAHPRLVAARDALVGAALEGQLEPERLRPISAELSSLGGERRAGYLFLRDGADGEAAAGQLRTMLSLMCVKSALSRAQAEATRRWVESGAEGDWDEQQRIVAAVSRVEQDLIDLMRREADRALAEQGEA